MKGFDKIFSFTFFQHLKSKGYRTTTLCIALVCLLVPMVILAGMEIFGGSAGDENSDYAAEALDMTGLERILIVDESEDKLLDFSQLAPFVKESGSIDVSVEDWGKDFEGAAKATQKDDGCLIILVEQDGELYTSNIIIPENSKVTEDMACQFQHHLDSYTELLSMIYSGELTEDYYESAEEEEEVISDSPEEEASDMKDLAVMIVSYLNVMILYFFVLAYGQSVANSVVMEKSSKLMENFLISVKPAAIILGKLLAITATGIIQFASWIIALVAGFAGGIGLVKAINPDAELTVLNILNMVRQLTDGFFTPVNCLLALLMIMVGLLLYCSLAGIGGALASKAEDLSSSNVIFTMVLVISFLAAIYAGALNGDSQAAPWLDFIPFTAVMITPAKVLLGVIPLWKSLVSLIIIVLTTLMATAVAGRLYKAMALYRGEVPKPQNIIKMLKG